MTLLLLYVSMCVSEERKRPIVVQSQKRLYRLRCRSLPGARSWDRGKGVYDAEAASNFLLGAGFLL
jgi:hypothetical protein